MPPTKIPLKPVTSWSFSRYHDYKSCPAKFKFKHLLKLPEPQNEAMARGDAIHKLAEKYIKGEGRTLPPELKLLGDEFKMLRALYKKKLSGMVVEDNWSFTNEWHQTRWDDWVKCWVRIKLDCAHVLVDDVMVVTDWKSGKFRPDQNEAYLEQLELYALSALLLHPRIQQVKPRLGYIDQGLFYPENPEELVFTRADISRLKKLWEKRVKPMFVDKTFAPRPNNNCRWCHFRKSNGGPCKF